MELINTSRSTLHSPIKVAKLTPEVYDQKIKSQKQNDFVNHMKEEKTLQEMYHVVYSKIK